MEAFELYIAYISWGAEGKKRPVLIIAENDDTACVFKITTKYENKNPAIQANYIVINDWKEAGLDKLSYVDTGMLIDLPLSVLGPESIGK